MNRLSLLVGVALCGVTGTAHAQHMGHEGHAMGDMVNPAPQTKEVLPAAVPSPDASDPHAGHDMPVAPMDHGAMNHDAMDHGAMAHGTGGTALPAGDAPAPPVAKGWAADSVYDPADMARSRAVLRKEHGGAQLSQIIFNLAEYRMRRGRDGFRWDGEGWFGGDIDRLVVRTEGEARLGNGVEDAEIQALYSHAIGPYFNLQAGVRQDIRPTPSRTYATIGVEGLAPYWFDVEAALFLSNKGDLLARLEAYYDQRITQRLILQPRIEMNFAAQDVRETGVGSGLSDGEFGLRLRYEIAREFAPYVGLSYDRRFGDTARFAQTAGEDKDATSVVTGIRFWF